MSDARWDETKDYPRVDIEKAHRTLINGGGMLGVVYRRVLRKNQELRKYQEERNGAYKDA